MTWQLHVPHQHCDDRLADVAAHAHDLPPEDRDVTRQLVLRAGSQGIRTAGALIDHLDRLDQQAGRDLVDRLRAELDLPDIATIDRQQRLEQLPHGENPLIQRCHYPQCTNIPTNAVGALREVHVKRWHCEQHEQYAQPGDLDPPPPPWRVSESGVLIENTSDAHDVTAERGRLAQLHARDTENQREAAEADAHEAALAARTRREVPPGVPT